MRTVAGSINTDILVYAHIATSTDVPSHSANLGYPNGSSNSPTLPFTYDDAGNLRTEAISSTAGHIFTHDAWNRLVKHEYSGSITVTQNAEYEYNGLHWRTIKRLPPVSSSSEEEGGTTIGGTLREMYYSAAWQLIEERADDDYDTSAGIDRVMQEYWGLRYIDDPVLRRVTIGETTERYYHLTDVQFSTVAMLGMAGRDPAPVVERVGYDAYGKASHRWPGDFNDDGNVNSSDAAIMAAASSPNTPMTSSGYDVRLDLNRDGQIDSSDDSLFTAMGSIAAINAGDISDHSSTGPDNVFGYDGYVFAPELLRYCVRFRWYDPVTGRWMQRDPAGYVDGMSLFQNEQGDPISRTDPLGLSPQPPRETFGPPPGAYWQSDIEWVFHHLVNAVARGINNKRFSSRQLTATERRRVEDLLDALASGASSPDCADARATIQLLHNHLDNGTFRAGDSMNRVGQAGGGVIYINARTLEEVRAELLMIEYARQRNRPPGTGENWIARLTVFQTMVHELSHLLENSDEHGAYAREREALNQIAKCSCSEALARDLKKALSNVDTSESEQTGRPVAPERPLRSPHGTQDRSY